MSLSDLGLNLIKSGLTRAKTLELWILRSMILYLESRAANQKPGNLIFFAPFNERTLIGRNLVGNFLNREK